MLYLRSLGALLNVFVLAQIILRRVIPKTPEDGSEHPTSHKFRKFLGLHDTPLDALASPAT